MALSWLMKNTVLLGWKFCSFYCFEMRCCWHSGEKYSVCAVCNHRKVLNSVRNWNCWSVTWKNKRLATSHCCKKFWLVFFLMCLTAGCIVFG